MDRSGANEDTYPMLVISRLITVTYLPIYWNGKRLNPRTSTSSIWNFNLLHCWRNLESILTFTCIRTFLRFSPKPYRRQYYVFWLIFAEILSPTNYGLFWETIAETLFWISTCWSKLYGIWLWLRLTISDALHRLREVPHVALLFI